MIRGAADPRYALRRVALVPCGAACALSPRPYAPATLETGHLVVRSAVGSPSARVSLSRRVPTVEALRSLQNDAPRLLVWTPCAPVRSVSEPAPSPVALSAPVGQPA